MNAFYTRQLNLYKFSALALGLLILFVSAAGSLGLVWMRQQISQSARNTVQLEREIQEADRENARLAAQIARAHQPENLLANASPALRPTSSAQVVWMPNVGTTFPDTFLAETRQRQPGATAESPLAISFDLALLNARSRPE